MMRYMFSGFILKFFSFNKITKRLYRIIANFVGEKKRIKNDNQIFAYKKRGDLLVELSESYCNLQNGGMAFELGTGWIHWYSLYLRLYFPVKILMFDIWDNRQFNAMRHFFGRLKVLIGDQQIFMRIDEMINMNSFDCLYSNFDLEYKIDDDGSLDGLVSDSLDLVFSFHVLEHVPVQKVDMLVKDFYRVLKDDGVCIHQIGIDDHLAHYDKKVSEKNYLKYSDTIWKLLFENDVQYINRLQPSEWVDIFAENGFELLERQNEFVNIDNLKIAKKYKNFTRNDLSTTIFTVVFKKNI